MMDNSSQSSHIEIGEALIGVEAMYQKFCAEVRPRSIACFVGLVDHYNEGKNVLGIDYEVHDTLALRILKEICQEVKQHFGHEIVLAIGISKGFIPAGGTMCYVLASAGNFKNAGDACQHVMQGIYKRVPIWKYEHYTDGTHTWLRGRYSLKN